MKRLWIFSLVVVLLGSSAFAAPAAQPPLTPQMKHAMDEVVSAFENESADLQYDYIEALNDGRGYTAGRAGFTTGTGDLLKVVKRYLLQRNARYRYRFIPLLPWLEGYSALESSSLVGLEALPTLWAQTAADDPVFRQVQDEVSDELYFYPAKAAAEKIGFNTPIGILVIYDTFIQHGKDGALRLIGQINPNVHTEKLRILNFLNIRHEELMHPCIDTTADVWRDSVGRVDALRELVNTNPQLHLPFVVNPFGTPITIR